MSLMPVHAQAMDRDVKSVIVAGEYGLVGGTILGLATVPFSQNIRTIFIGSSAGLYLGIAVGFYYITHRDDPDNPFRSNQRGGDPMFDEHSMRADPQTRERELRMQAGVRPAALLQLADEVRPPLTISVAVVKF